MSRLRTILECEPENYILAVRAAKWLLKSPATQKDAILSYGEDLNSAIVFYVRRTKSGVSVRENTR